MPWQARGNGFPTPQGGMITDTGMAGSGRTRSVGGGVQATDSISGAYARPEQFCFYGNNALQTAFGFRSGLARRLWPSSQHTSAASF